MGKYWKIWWRILNLNLMTAMMYKTDLVVGVTVSLIYLITHLLFIKYFFEVGGLDNLVGFSRQDFYFVFGWNQVMFLLGFAIVCSSGNMLTRGIHNGMLDLKLIQPINSVFLLSSQQIFVDDVISAILYMVGVIYFGLSADNLNLSLVDWWQVLFVFAISLIVIFVFWWMTFLVWFFRDRFSAFTVFFMYVTDAIRFPRKIYPDWMQSGLTFVFPVLVMVNPIFDVLKGNLSRGFALQLILVCLMYIIIYLIMWRGGLRRYNSAA